MTNLQALFWLGCLCLIAVLADKKEHSGKASHDVGKGGKHHHLLGHWGEHWSMVGKPTSKHEAKDAMKHAPSFVSHHDVNMQSDLGYKKNSHDNKHKPMADLHLQDLLMEESQRHETREQKISKVRPNHSIHHRQESHQVPKPRPTNMEAIHPHNRMEHPDYFHHNNKPTSSSLGHNKATKNSQKKIKPRKVHSKEKKLDKKFPKKYNQRKHEKKMMMVKH